MDQIEEIKNKINIVDLISEFVTLKKVGRNFKGLCPFHNEKTPSFIVSPERQIWHCFGCSEGGNVFDFLMRRESIEFGEALRILAKRAGIVLKTYRPTGESQIKEKLYEINHLAAEFYHYLLEKHPIAQKAREYLQKRGIKEKTRETFKIGFAPGLWQSASKYLLEKKGFTVRELEQVGLIIQSQHFYDRFRGRIIFPLFDHRDNIVGFAGRLLDPNAKEAKYVNSPETLIYNKSNHLFGINLAKEAIKKENLAILVEGEMDMISSFQAGVTNVVAIKGSALTAGHVQLLSRYTENIAFALDTDFAGNNAASRGIEIADASGLNMKVVELLYGKDPDECIQKDPSLWFKSVKQAVPVYDYLFNFAKSKYDLNSAEGKKKIAAEVLPFLAKINNEIVKYHYIKKLANLLVVNEEAINRELNKINRDKVVRNFISSSPVFSPKPPKNRQELLEETLISLILQDDDINKSFAVVEQVLTSNDFQTPVLKKIFKFLEDGSGSKDWSRENIFKIIPPELMPTFERIYLLIDEDLDKNSEKRILTLEKTAKALLELSLKRQINEVARKIQGEENVGDRTADLNEEYRKLTQSLKEIQ